MEKGRYQKLKLLYLLEILRDYSDENTYLSVKELTTLLLKKEIIRIFGYWMKIKIPLKF